MSIREFSLEFSGPKSQYRPVLSQITDPNGGHSLRGSQTRRARGGENFGPSPVRRGDYRMGITQKPAGNSHCAGVEFDEDDDAGDDDTDFAGRREQTQ